MAEPPAPVAASAEAAAAPEAAAAAAVASPASASASAPVSAQSPQKIDLGLVLARMAEIDADLEKLTKPWPAWMPIRGENDEDSSDEEELNDSDEMEDEADGEEAGEAEGDGEVAGDAGPEDDDVAEDDDVEEVDEVAEHADALLDDREQAAASPKHKEVDDDEAVADSTVVLRSVPIALYLQREGQEPIRMTSDRFIIGRGSHCDLIIDSPRVSREHAVLTRAGILYCLEDLNSSNGTWFGEERITRRELETGDVISLGNVPLTFILRAE